MLTSMKWASYETVSLKYSSVKSPLNIHSTQYPAGHFWDQESVWTIYSHNQIQRRLDSSFWLRAHVTTANHALELIIKVNQTFDNIKIDLNCTNKYFWYLYLVSRTMCFQFCGSSLVVIAMSLKKHCGWTWLACRKHRSEPNWTMKNTDWEPNPINQH